MINFGRRVLPRPLLDHYSIREGLEHRTRAISVDVAEHSGRAVPVVLRLRDLVNNSLVESLMSGLQDRG